VSHASYSLQSHFDAALQDYASQTRTRLDEHPIAKQLLGCDSVESISCLLQEQARRFGESQGDNDGKILKSLNSAIHVLYTLSAITALGEGIGLQFPPAKAISAGVAVLLEAAQEVSASYDVLVDLFESIESFLSRLEVYTKIPLTEAMTAIVIKIMAEVLSTLALATKQVNQGRRKKVKNKMIGENEIKAVLRRLDRLTLDEARVTGVQTLDVVYSLVQNGRAIMDNPEDMASVEIMHQIANDINILRRNELKKSLRKWLSPADPCISHNIARKYHHGGTGTSWIHGDTFASWNNSGPGSLIWIHGKPGAGKSVLTSSTIENIRTTRPASLAFYYYDFRDGQKKGRRGLLSSLLAQLGDQSPALCATEHWVTHARFEDVSPNTEAMQRLFDPFNHHLSLWLWTHDPQARWHRFNGPKLQSQPRETPLHYAACCGLHEFVKFLIVERLPEGVNARGFNQPNRPPCPSIGPSQSASQMHISALPTDQSTSPCNRTSPAVPSPDLLRSISNSPPLSTLKSRISEDSKDMNQDSSNDDSPPVEAVENVLSMTATTNASGPGSINPPHPRDDSGSNTTDNDAGTAPEREHESSGTTGQSLYRASFGGGYSGSSASPNDILVDGFIARTSSYEGALNILTVLLRRPDYPRYCRISCSSYSRGVWYITENARHRRQPSLGIPTQISSLPLNFSIRTTQGTIVPQPRWVPADEIDGRRHIHDATLQLPIFFVNRNNGAVGFWLTDILQGHDGDLHNRDSHALLGGRATTRIRINWPGYGSWKRQIPTLDKTFDRNPITLGRFMRHVGSSVNKFFDQCMENGYGADPRWGIGPQGITQRHVKVIGAVHISAGSWMPIIQLTGFVLQGHTNSHTPMIDSLWTLTRR